MVRLLRCIAFCAVCLGAIPTPNHSLRMVKRNNPEVPFYYPRPVVRNYKIGKSFRSLSHDEVIVFGKSQLLLKLQAEISDVVFDHHYTDLAGTTHIYATHSIRGILVDNHHASIHVKRGQILTFTTSFTIPMKDRQPESRILRRSDYSVEDAIKHCESKFGAVKDANPAKKVFIEVPSGILILSHQFQLKNDEESIWIQVSVDVRTNLVVQVVDYIQKSSYKVIELPKSNPTDRFGTIFDPADKMASPRGWHDDGVEYTDTQGNNVDSRIGLFPFSQRVEGGSLLNFYTNWDPTEDPWTRKNRDAAIVNVFYICNMMHDISYQYGFTESAGNFQNDNYGRSGLGNDRLIVNNQAIGKNNANFASPPDGQNPEMNMYLWMHSFPQRDGSLDNGIPIHEYMHGISSRMTGGPLNANCLSSPESAALSEGWSDAMVLYLLHLPTDTRETSITLGSYILDTPEGIRSKPYSTDMTINPYTFSFTMLPQDPHTWGELWANTLFELYWNLVDHYGFTPDYLNAAQQFGNIIALQIMIGGLALQPCSPTFLSARDAIIAADVSYYNGQNECMIWKAFAKRGMGVHAIDAFNENFDLPETCF